MSGKIADVSLYTMISLIWELLMKNKEKKRNFEKSWKPLESFFKAQKSFFEASESFFQSFYYITSRRVVLILLFYAVNSRDVKFVNYSASTSWKLIWFKLCQLEDSLRILDENWRNFFIKLKLTQISRNVWGSFFTFAHIIDAMKKANISITHWNLSTLAFFHLSWAKNNFYRQ